MDLVSLIGGLLSIGAILTGVFIEKIPITQILSPFPLVFVTLGTLGAVLLSFPWRRVKEACAGIQAASAHPAENLKALLDEIVELSTVARREGFVAIDPKLQDCQNSFLAQAMKYVVDGFERPSVEQILKGYAESRARQGREVLAFWQNLASYSPGIGVIGAVLAFLGALSHFSEPELLASGLLSSFVCFLYGLALAHFIFLPLSVRAENSLRFFLREQEMVRLGVLGIQEGQSPKFIEESLKLHIDEESSSED